VANGIDPLLTPAYLSFDKIRKTPNLPFVFEMEIRQSFNVGWNRDLCLTESRAVKQTKLPYDYALMLDADSLFTQREIEQLLAHGLPMVSGAYPRKNDKNEIHAGYWASQVGLIGRYISGDETGVQPCDWVGGGFLLIDVDVLAKMNYPWFDDAIKVPYYDDGVLCSSTCNEAHCFCLKAACRNSIFVDCDCKVNHANL
jgi:hypothetical protein